MAPVIVLTKYSCDADAKPKPMIIHFDGDYADMWQLFKFRKITGAPGFIKASEFRTKYVALVQASEYGKEAPVIIPANRPKRLLYHYMLIKMLLTSLDLLELESEFAKHWDMDELPMLDQYQFNYWDIRLTVYNRDMTPRPTKLVRLFQRRCDSWFNLTSAAAEHDGDEIAKHHISDMARDNYKLFKRLELEAKLTQPKTLDDPPSDKKPSVAEKRALANKYVDVLWSRQETWCHPAVFDETMRTLFWDWRMKSSNAFVNPNPVAARREILRPSQFEDVEYFPSGPPVIESEPESDDEIDPE